MLLFFCCVEEIFLFSIIAQRISFPVLMIANGVLILAILLFLILSIMEKKPDKNDIKKFIIFFILALLFGVTRSYLYIFSLLIAYIFIDDEKKLYKWIFIVSTFCFSIYMIMVLFSFIPDLALIRFDEGEITNIRHTFGFNNPNHPLKFYLTAMISGYLWMCDTPKKTFIFSFTALLLAVFIAHNTNCRTGLLICFLFFFLINIPKIFIFIKAKWLYILFTLLTVFLVVSYPLGLNFINEALSGRPWWYNFYFKEYSEFIVFGKCYYPLVLHAYKNPLDNSFLYILFDGGIFAFIAINFVYFLAFRNNKDKKITISLFVLLTYSLTETLSTPFMNLLYIIMFAKLLSHFNQIKNKDLNENIIKE